MVRPDFQQTVERIRQLDAREGATAFEMGDAVLEQVPMGRDGVNNDSTAILQRLAEESGVEYSTLYDRRLVAAAVPPAVRTVGVAWSVYRQIALYAPAPERQRLLKLVNTKPPTQLVDGAWRTPKQNRWTVDAIRTHFGEKAKNPATGSEWLVDRAFKGAEPQTIAAAVEQVVVQQPAVLDAMLSKPETRRAVYEGLHRHEQQVTDRTERLTQADPIARNIDQHQAMLDLERWGDHVRHDIERLHSEILPRLGQIPDADPLAFRRFLAEMLADLDEAIQPVRTFVDTGSMDIDRFLQDVLGKKG